MKFFMNRKVLFFTFILLFSMESHSAVDLYGGMNVGNSSIDEYIGNNSYRHESTFFIGHWGASLGLRLKLDLGPIGIGMMGEGAWVGDSLNRSLTGSSATNTYRHESFRLISGIATSLHFGVFSLLAEYYPSVQNSISYSDAKSENPFRKNDALKGTGYGLGFSFDLGSGFSYFAIYKKLTYKDVQMNGTSVNLPSTQYTPYIVDDVLAGIAKSF